MAKFNDVNLSSLFGMFRICNKMQLHCSIQGLLLFNESSLLFTRRLSSASLETSSKYLVRRSTSVVSNKSNAEIEKNSSKAISRLTEDEFMESGEVRKGNNS